MKRLLFPAALFAPLLAGGALADEAIRIFDGGRYIRVAAIPGDDQLAPLQSVISVTFAPSEVRTVGDAARMLLQHSGYAMPDADARAAPDHARAAGFTLPDIHRRFEGVTILKALEALGGAAYRPVVDDVNRTVTFALKKETASTMKAQRETRR